MLEFPVMENFIPASMVWDVITTDKICDKHIRDDDSSYKEEGFDRENLKTHFWHPWTLGQKNTTQIFERRSNNRDILQNVREGSDYAS